MLDPKSMAIASFALCGFANFSSIAMQIGGIGEMAPSRKKDLAELGLRALLCGTMASYISSALAGILIGWKPSADDHWVVFGLMAGAIGIIVLAKRLPSGSLDIPTLPGIRPSTTSGRGEFSQALKTKEARNESAEEALI